MGTCCYSGVGAACSFTPPTSLTNVLDLVRNVMENFIDFYVSQFLVITPIIGVIYNVFELIDCKGEASSIALFLLYLYYT